MSRIHDARVRGAVVLLDAATLALVAVFDALPPPITTTLPVGGWTPARHLWHLALTHDVFSGVLRGDGPVRAGGGRFDFTDEQWSFSSPPAGPAPALVVPPSDVTAAPACLRESVAHLTT